MSGAMLSTLTFDGQYVATGLRVTPLSLEAFRNDASVNIVFFLRHADI
jgi:hypothetical protein